MKVSRIASVLVLLAGTASVHAQDITKTVTWTLDNAPAAGVVGNFAWDLRAQALGKIPNVLDTQPEAGNANWALTLGLGNTAKQTNVATSGTATSQAKIDFQAGAPAAGPGGTTQITSAIHINNTAASPDGRFANAKSSGTMTIPGGLVTGVVITQPGKKASTKPNLVGQTSAGFGAYKQWNDPIAISLYAASNPSTPIFSQVIGSIDAYAGGAGDMKWDNTGLTMSAPSDGFSKATLNIAQPAGQLTGAGFAGSATWQNGQLTLTGMLASLPWQISGATARLSPGVMDSISFGYQIPSSMVSASSMYFEKLSYSSYGEINTVPTPGSLALLGLGSALVAKRRRRLAAI